ncbi:MAG TPA: nucleoside hydrolase [Anaerolineae bacterium]|nr:nucleoside hydrolase [Anaerolineae bacterium]
MIRLVIDTDPGVDDARAMMLAFAHLNARVEAIMTVAGNVGVEQTTANACYLLDVLNVSPEQTPIYRGAATGILGSNYDGVYFHGTDGFGNNHFPRSPRRIASERAAEALIRYGNEKPGELTLVAIGPLTNLALVTRLEPELPSKYNRLVIMGGTIRGTGNNRHNPSAEFNAYMDPEAMAIVLENWHNIWLVSWETTLEHPLDAPQVETLMNWDTMRGKFWAQITRESLEFVTKRLGRPTLLLPDEIAMAVAVEPEIVKRSELRYMSAELHGEHTRGQTTVDWFNATGHEPNVNIVLEIDRARFFELLVASVM